MVHCKWGTCNSNSRYKEHMNVFSFYPFPKPCKYFRAEKKDPTLKIKHDTSICGKCSKAQAWIRACRVEGILNLDQISYNCYVCCKHFVDGMPTEQHPIPTPAGSVAGKTFTSRKSPMRRMTLKDNAPSLPTTMTASPSPSTSSPSKRELKRQLEVSNEKCENYRKKVKVLQQKVRRQEKRMQTVTQVLNELKDQQLVEESVKTKLQRLFWVNIFHY